MWRGLNAEVGKKCVTEQITDKVEQGGQVFGHRKGCRCPLNITWQIGTGKDGSLTVRMARPGEWVVQFSVDRWILDWPPLVRALGSIGLFGCWRREWCVWGNRTGTHAHDVRVRNECCTSADTNTIFSSLSVIDNTGQEYCGTHASRYWHPA